MRILESKADQSKRFQRAGRQNQPQPKERSSFASVLGQMNPGAKESFQEQKRVAQPKTLADYRAEAVPARLSGTFSARRAVVRESPIEAADKAVVNDADESANLSQPIRDAIEDASRKYDLPAGLIRAVIRVESNFNPKAVSSEGASGLMQLMPQTARMLGVKHIFDIRENIDGGCQYLREMIDRFNGDRELALAAYNAGPGAVEKHRGVPPYRETRNYVRNVLARC